MSSVSADSKVKIWDLRKGEALFSLYGHSGSVNDIQFSQTGDYFVSGGEDKLLLVWKSNFTKSCTTKEKSVKQKTKNVNGKVVSFPQKAVLETKNVIQHKQTSIGMNITTSNVDSIGIDEISQRSSRKTIEIEIDPNVERTLNVIMGQMGKICEKIDVNTMLTIGYQLENEQ